MVGIRIYGELEFVLGTIKVAALIGLILFGIIYDLGGVDHDRRGFRYWSRDGVIGQGYVENDDLSRFFIVCGVTGASTES